MVYVDGYVLPVARKNMRVYKQMAQKAGRVWRKHGALEYWECVGDDLKTVMGMVPFPRLAKLKRNEAVVFSWILFKSKADRNRVNAKVMKDPIMNDPKYKDKPMPFEIKRMAYGGFSPIVKLKARGV